MAVTVRRCSALGAIIRGFDDPLTIDIQEARGWQNYDTWGEAILGRIKKQSGEFQENNPYGTINLPKITGNLIQKSYLVNLNFHRDIQKSLRMIIFLK